MRLWGRATLLLGRTTRLLRRAPAGAGRSRHALAGGLASRHGLGSRDLCLALQEL